MSTSERRKKSIILSMSLIFLIFAVSVYAANQPSKTSLRRFSGMEELEFFLRERVLGSNILVKNFLTLDVETMEGGVKRSNSDVYSSFSYSSSDPNSYSTTNIQVAGVDEADIVKSDGRHIYISSGDTVYIVRAYPPEGSKVLSKIKIDGAYQPQIYIRGDRLVVIGSAQAVIFAKVYPPPAPTSFVKICDISDRSSPVLVRELKINGSVSGSRMIGEYVYIVSNKWPYTYDYEIKEMRVELPSYTCDSLSKEVLPEEIYYIDSEEGQYSFITVISINVADESVPPSDETFLAGASSCMYVSRDNMYLVAHRYRPIVITYNLKSITEWREETIVYRLSLKNGKITVDGSGSVPGHVLNQYSMDEYGGYFRIATTKWTSLGSENGIYVMNMKMQTVGSVENIAPGERIYAARFMGDWCYLVTFRQVDPFFVIDLSDPNSPTVLGYLKIPGYSSYLHPFDEDHIIGIGKEGNNVKLSLFDVSNVKAPKEVAKFGMEFLYSDSEVLYDPKAFLFCPGKQLLSIPISWSEGKSVLRYFRGACVFNLTVDGGFVLRGIILHQNDQEGVRRILYVDDVLYTFSRSQVCMSNLTTLDLIKSVDLR
ncbi:MAG: beta-propeller domain-containing protein [Candidatus Methanomethyliaceae archaeon]|nr:beta-propeller domain-containing protein [Candidatus Methanomethyliaceae archaeon]